MAEEEGEILTLFLVYKVMHTLETRYDDSCPLSVWLKSHKHMGRCIGQILQAKQIAMKPVGVHEWDRCTVLSRFEWFFSSPVKEQRWHMLHIAKE